MLKVAQDLGVPLRHHHPGLNYCGRFYGRTAPGGPFSEAITLAGLMNTIRALPAGWTEMVCHPGVAGDDLGTDYCAERAQEAAVLRDHQIRLFLQVENVSLASFHSQIPQQSRSW